MEEMCTKCTKVIAICMSAANTCQNKHCFVLPLLSVPLPSPISFPSLLVLLDDSQVSRKTRGRRERGEGVVICSSKDEHTFDPVVVSGGYLPRGKSNVIS